ncbi:MAG: sensor histidine kinase [Pseudonocardiales bacterium]
MASQAALTIQARPQRVVWIFRAVLLVLCLVVAAAGHSFGPAVAGVIVLLAVAAAPVRLPQESLTARFARAAEVSVICAAVLLTQGATGAFFLLLAVPVLAAGLFSGAIDATILTGLGAAILLAAGAATDRLTDVAYLDNVGQGVVIALAAGLVAAWSRRLLRLQPTVDQPLFGTAYRLLTQLRSVARQLPGTLDPVSISTQLADDLKLRASADSVAVFARTGGERLVQLGGDADAAQQWDVQITGDSLFADAWAAQAHRLTAVDGDGWLLIFPLLVGIRTVGLVGLQGRDRAPDLAAVGRMNAACADAALRLETALLFDEVRDLATTEERQRVAREIHDGIAQELVIVGYGIDHALAETPEGADDARTALGQLRVEVTRIISELRLSLFDLRSDIDPHGGLGAAISAYVRTIGASSGLTVHITLDESTRRLPAATEAELFRITQEAVTNARKHARASNLWVSVTVQPAHATIVVEDDGVGMPTERRQDSYGQAIMRERAARLGAALEVGARQPHGTRVHVQLGLASPGRTLAAGNGVRQGVGSAHRPSDR